jgi:ABC-type multidrug transport system fused ATPase/permease subunit
MKGLKISGLAIPITNFVHQLRLDEIKAGRAARGISVIAAIASLTPLVLSPLVAFAAAQRELNAAKVFTSLSYLMLLSNPLIMTFQAVPQIVSALACLGRIQAFLACTTREDMRTVIASIARFSEKQAEEDSQMASTDSSEPAIIIRDGQFGWTKEKMALRNINLEVPKSYLTVVVGPIASGKSTLTKALLGEIPVSEGRVEINTKFPRIGFCDQM